MAIDSEGNVGIGINPTTILHVHKPSASCSPILSSGTGAVYLSMRGANGTHQVQYGDGITDASYSFYDNKASTERMRIDASGNLLVGKTSTLDGEDGLVLSPTRPWCSKADSSNSNHAWGMYDTSTLAYRFYVGWGGTIFASSTSISAISDKSLKENIRDLDKGLDTVLALKPRRFDWKNGDGNDIMGFIAQEVDEVLPELVHDYMYNEDETKKSLKMGDMIPSMVKAIQEQQAMIETLQAEVAALKGA